MRDGVCIGGLTRDTLRNVRLLPSESGHSQPVDAPYQIGDVWEMELGDRVAIRPPHVEDMIVRGGRRIAPQTGLDVWLQRFGRPVVGPVSALFDGCLRLTATGTAYVGAASIPAGSVAFWRPVDDLPLGGLAGDRYQVPWRDGCISVKYVGVQPPLPVIKAGTLVRVSLSRWFQPGPGAPERCWLQISGWYAPSQSSHQWPAVRRAERPQKPVVPRSIERRPEAPSSPHGQPGVPIEKPSAATPPTPLVPLPPRQPALAHPDSPRRLVITARARTMLRQLAPAFYESEPVRGRMAPIVRQPSRPNELGQPAARPRRVRASVADPIRLEHSAAQGRAQARAQAFQEVMLEAIADIAKQRKDAVASRPKVDVRSLLPPPPDWREPE